jgi:hypothetical protein
MRSLIRSADIFTPPLSLIALCFLLSLLEIIGDTFHQYQRLKYIRTWHSICEMRFLQQLHEFSRKILVHRDLRIFLITLLVHNLYMTCTFIYKKILHEVDPFLQTLKSAKVIIKSAIVMLQPCH